MSLIFFAYGYLVFMRGHCFKIAKQCNGWSVQRANKDRVGETGIDIKYLQK